MQSQSKAAGWTWRGLAVLLALVLVIGMTPAVFAETDAVPTVYNAPFVELATFDDKAAGTAINSGNDNDGNLLWETAYVSGGERGNAVQWTMKRDDGYWGQNCWIDLGYTANASTARELWFWVDFSNTNSSNPDFRIYVNGVCLLSATAYYISDADRIPHETQVGEWGSVAIPAQFKGWIRVPYTGWNGKWDLSAVSSVSIACGVNNGGYVIVDSFCTLSEDWVAGTHGLPSERLLVPMVEKAPFTEILNFDKWPLGTVGNDDVYGKPQDMGYWELKTVENGEHGNALQWNATKIDGFWGQAHDLWLSGVDASGAKELWAYVDLSGNTRSEAVLRLNIGSESGWTGMDKDKPLSYISESDRIIHHTQVGEWGEFFLPTNFVGWVRIPMTSFKVDGSLDMSALTRINLSFTLNQGDTAIIDTVCVLNEDWNPVVHGLPAEREILVQVPVVEDTPFTEIMNFDKLPLGDITANEAYGKPQDNGYWALNVVENGENGNALQWTSTKVDGFWGQAHDLYFGTPMDITGIKELWAYVDLSGNTRTEAVLRLNLGSESGWTGLNKTQPLSYISTDDRIVHNTQVGEWGEFFLPTNFVGWVRIPMTSFAIDGNMNLSAMTRVSVSFTLNQGDTAVIDTVCMLDADWDPAVHGLPSERKQPDTVPVVENALFEELLNFDRWPLGGIGNDDGYGHPQDSGYWELTVVENVENGRGLQWTSTKADGFWGQAHDLYFGKAVDMTEVKELWLYVDLTGNTRMEPVLRLNIGTDTGWTGLEKTKPFSYFAEDDRIVNHSQVGEWGELFLPTNFVGWVRVPMTSFKTEGELDIAAVTRMVLSFTMNEGDTAKVDTLCILKTDWVAETHGLPADRAICEHNYESVVTEPEIGKEGYTTHTCTKCGDSYVDSYTDALEELPPENDGEDTPPPTGDGLLLPAMLVSVLVAALGLVAVYKKRELF